MTTSSPANAPRPAPLRTRIWDLPTRLFHWALALTVFGLLGTGFNGILEWHFRLGYVALALLLFRVIWGFIGGRWSRFASFLYAPSSIVAYLRGRAPATHRAGHSPLGALSVFALLALLLAQISTGLMTDDQISAAGPLTRFVSSAVVDTASYWHTEPGKLIVIALIALHLLALLFYMIAKKKALVRPMITGDKFGLEDQVKPSRDNILTRLLALLVFALCAVFAAWIASLRL